MSNNIAYIHIPKCGGSTVNSLLGQLTSGSKQRDRAHEPIPVEECRGKMVVTSVRDPFAWYLSWWSHVCRSNGSHYRKFNTDSFWRSMWSDIHDPKQFRRFVRTALRSCQLDQPYLRYRFFQHGMLTRRLLHLCTRELTALDRKWMDEEECGTGELLEHWHRFNYLDRVIKLERFAEDSKKCFGDLVTESSDFDEALEVAAVKNITSQLEVQEAYDSETEELVVKAESFAFEVLDYKTSIS